MAREDTAREGMVEPGGVRTADLLNAIQALSQLSYGPSDGNISNRARRG